MKLFLAIAWASAVIALYLFLAFATHAQTSVRFGRTITSPTLSTICAYDRSGTRNCNPFLSVNDATHVVTIGGVETSGLFSTVTATAGVSTNNLLISGPPTILQFWAGLDNLTSVNANLTGTTETDHEAIMILRMANDKGSANSKHHIITGEQMMMNAGSGDGYVHNFALNINSGVGNKSAIATEIDLTNLNQDYPTTKNGGTKAANSMIFAYGPNTFPASSAIKFGALPGVATFAIHNGLYFTGATLIQDETIYDETSSGISYFDDGNHVNGIKLTGTYSGPAIIVGTPGGGGGSATPTTVSFDNTFSTTAGANPKLSIFNNTYGFGVSAGRLDYMAPTGAAHTLYVNGVSISSLSATALTIQPTTASTSPTTGALIDSGGLGVAGAAWFGTSINATALLGNVTSPTISSGFCTSPSVPTKNGTFAFTINVGSACATSTGTIEMPTAANGWVCHAHDVTTPATNVVEQSGGTTTTVVLTNYVRTTGIAGNFTSSNVIRVGCTGY